ncbi:MAG TPA: hypothetical protein VGC76_12760 [Pyrinomonadaceae bacterium]|jgi:hypothetical protein
MKKLAFAAAVLTAIILFGGSENARAQSGTMEWRGSVDDTVQVIVRGRNATTNTLSGSETNDDRASFNGRLPRDNTRVWVNKTNGRGRVYIVQQPNRRNNFTAIIQIVDNKGGRDRYSFTLSWE